MIQTLRNRSDAHANAFERKRLKDTVRKTGFTISLRLRADFSTGRKKWIYLEAVGPITARRNAASAGTEGSTDERETSSKLAESETRVNSSSLVNGLISQYDRL